MLKFDFYVDDSNEYGVLVEKILNNNKDFRLIQFSEDDEYYYFIGRIYNPIKNYTIAIYDGPIGLYFDIWNLYKTKVKKFFNIEKMFNFLNNCDKLNAFLERI